MSKYQAPRGTQDVLPEVSQRYQRLEAAFRDVCLHYRYREIRTPLFEETDLFVRGVGEGTEVVSKQMYTFQDRGGRSLTLRAEGTAPVMRAVLEHNLCAQGRLQKLYYIAPIFRYERPQAGRLRQHTQLGVEALGAPGPDIDAEVIALYHDFLAAIGLPGSITHISSIGCPDCRPALYSALRAFFAPKLSDLCDFCQARYQSNPLRILDCKVPQDVAARQDAPSALDHLCPDCLAHFTDLRRLLDLLSIPYQVDPTIVRGLDYYTRTAFEVIHPALGAKDVIIGGGRYDGLAEILGGPHLPGIGFGSGLERLSLVLQETSSYTPPEAPSVYLAAVDAAARREVLLLAQELRRNDIPAELDYAKRSLKAQMKEADRSGAALVLVIGEDELQSHSVTLRHMQTGQQILLPRAVLVAELAALLQENNPPPAKDSS